MHTTTDYTGQDLRGQSFKNNKNLNNANFSACDLRGVNFSGAELTTATFQHAKMGRTLKSNLLILPIKFLTGAVAGYSIPKNNIVFVDWINASLAEASITISKASLTHLLHLYFFLLCALLVHDYQKRQLQFTPWFVALSLGFGVFGLNILTTIASLTGSAIITMSVAVIITLGEISAICLAILGVYAGLAAITLETQEMLQGFDASLLFACFGAQLLFDAYHKRPALSFFHNLGALLNSWGSTQFAYATLKNVDFSAADLHYACFKDAIMQGCRFQHSKNMHLAITDGTPLGNTKVQALMIHGELGDKNFAHLDLRGLDLSGLDLQGVNFANVNASLTNFSHCNLAHANLSEINVVGANFTQTNLTGACIKNWNIDTRTQLDAIACDYVYLQENQQQRDPPEHIFAPGEFSKLYQRIADTIDLIAHTHEELITLSTALKNVLVQAGNEDVFVQAIERKENSIVVRIKTPASIERETIYKEVKQAQQKELRRIQQQYEQHLLSQQIQVDTEKRANQDKSEFIVHAAHDLRNIVEPINIFLDIGAKAIAQGNITQANHLLQQVVSASHSLGTSIDNLEEIAKLDSGLLTINPTTFDIWPLAQEVLNEAQPYAWQQQVTLHPRHPEAQTIRVHSDRQLLKRVLMNLVVNGIKYADPAKGTAAHVVIAIVSHANRVRIDIIDNGIGIAEQEHEPIFQALYQINGQQQTTPKGSGLGLASVRKILTLLTQHQLKLRSNLGVGTRISISVPRGGRDSQ